MKTNSELLLTRYFTGNATTEELEQLEKWIAESTENEAEFIKMTKVFESTGNSVESDFNFDAAKANFNKYIKADNKKVKRVSINRMWLYAAASVAIIALLSVFYTSYMAPHTVLYSSGESEIDEVLPDNSRIILGAKSSLSFTTNKLRGDKTAVLSGSVKWAVAHQKDLKLKLSACGTIIEDIGTVFEVLAYPDKDFVQVSVTEGMVHFYTKEQKGLMIKAGETGLYDKKSRKFRSLASEIYKNGQKTIELNLEGIALGRAVEVISKAYGADIVLQSGDFKDKQITVQFSDEKLSTVLQVLAQTLQLKLDKTGNTYYLSVN